MTSQRRHRVVVGFDGSTAAQAALAWAVPEARLHGVPLVAVTVLRDPGPDVAEEEILGPLRRLIAEIAGDGFEFRHFHGSPAAGLVAACGPRDLLVVGSAGAAGAGRRWARWPGPACTTPPARWRWSRSSRGSGPGTGG